jgi:DNA modification methylase
MESSRKSFSPFSVKICDYIVSFFLKNSKKVFDPFAGWGERHFICKKYNKDYIGFDISKDAIHYAYKHFGVTNFLDNSKTAYIPNHDALITCPPYWNIEIYNNENGLDKIKSWELFLIEYEYILKRVIKKASSNAVYCIVVGDFRKNHIFYNLSYYTENIMLNNGFSTFDKIIIDSKKQTPYMTRTAQPKAMGYSMKIHQYLLVFKKIK